MTSSRGCCKHFQRAAGTCLNCQLKKEGWLAPLPTQAYLFLLNCGALKMGFKKMRRFLGCRDSQILAYLEVLGKP